MSEELEQNLLVERILNYLLNLKRIDDEEIEEIVEMAIVNLEISDKQKEETYRIINEELNKQKNKNKFQL